MTIGGVHEDDLSARVCGVTIAVTGGGSNVPDYARMYAGQDYMTPGAAQTVGIIADTVRFEGNPWLLDMAAGKGTAAATLAGRHPCRIVCVESHGPFVLHSLCAIRRLGLDDRVRVVQASGRQLPVRAGTMNAAYCIGAPSIVGLTAALAEMARVVVPGGRVIVSDITWRDRPGPLGREWRWVADAAQTTTDQYAAELTSAGLRVSGVTVHGRDAWEEYWQPMLAVANDATTLSGGGDLAFADEVQQIIAMERRAVDAWLDYTTFTAVKPR